MNTKILDVLGFEQVKSQIGQYIVTAQRSLSKACAIK